MNKRTVFYILAKIVFLEAVLMILPALVSLYYKEYDTMKVFLLAALAAAVISLPLILLKPKNTQINFREGIVIAALGWIVIPILGAIPFYASGEIPSFVDAIFESVSGFTTTGSTILTDIEALSRGMIFWRSFTHWVGGMGVLVLTIAILPSDKNSSSLNLMKGECAGPQVGKLVPKGKWSAMILYIIYAIMTVIMILMLLIGDMPLFDSVCHAMAAAGTGGFGIKNAGVAFYNSTYIEWVIAIFMILFGINFNMYYFLLIRKISYIYKNTELKVYLGIIIASSATIAVNVYNLYENLGLSIRHAFFQVSSIITSTGFATVDFNKWPEFSKMLIIMLMFVGACAGSTGGGFKVARIVIMFKSARKSIRKMIHPKSVNLVKSDDRTIDVETVHGVHSYLIIYLGIIVASLLLISLNNFDFATSFTAVTTCVNNIGPGISKIGPMDNFSIFSDFSKIVLSIDMLLGRLECLPLIMMMSPAIWRKKFY